MDSSIKTSPAISRGFAVACVALLVAGVLVALGGARIESVSREAIMFEAICKELLNNSVEGRQALISSAWWPPLPVLVRMPLFAVVGEGWGCVSSIIVSAVFGCACLLAMQRMLWRMGMGPARFILVAALALNPAFFRACVDGSSATMVVFLAMLCAYGLMRWVSRRNLRELVYLGMSSAMLCAASFEMAVWLIFVFALLILDLHFYKVGPHQKESVLLLGLLPTLYTVALWCLANWLIMGDFLYFIRPVVQPHYSTDISEQGVRFAYDAELMLAAGCAMTVFLFGIRLRRKAAVYGGVATLSLVLLGMLFGVGESLWNDSLTFLVVSALAILSLGALAEGAELPEPGRLGAVIAVVVGVIMMGTSVAKWVGTEAVAERSESARLRDERDRWLPRIKNHVLKQSRHSKVYVCGYDSFILLGGAPDDVFIKSLDFNFNKAKLDYQGHVLYLLIHRPSGSSAAGSVHWKFDGIFWLGSHSALFDSDWGEWRLFEIIQAQRRAL